MNYHLVMVTLGGRYDAAKDWISQAKRLAGRVRAHCKRHKLRIAGAPPLDLPGCDTVSIGHIRVLRQYDATSGKLAMRADTFAFEANTRVARRG